MGQLNVWGLTNASLDQAPGRLKREYKIRRKEEMKIFWWVSLVFLITNVGALSEEPQLSSPRVVFQVLSFLPFHFTFTYIYINSTNSCIQFQYYLPQFFQYFCFIFSELCNKWELLLSVMPV